MSKRVKIIGVRVTEEINNKIRTITKARGEDISDFVRRSILKELANLSYLSKEQKKALGIKIENADVS